MTDLPPVQPIQPPSDGQQGLPPRPATTIHSPGVGVMWINAALFWGIIPGIYLLYLTFRNITWAVQNRQPWLRYALPLGTLIALLALLMVVASSLEPSSPTPYTPYGQ